MWTRARGERRSPSEEKIRDCDGIFGLAICRYSRLFDSPSHFEPWYHFAAISRVYFCKQTCLYGRPLLFCSGAFPFLPLTVRYWNDGFVMNPRRKHRKRVCLKISEEGSERAKKRLTTIEFVADLSPSRTVISRVPKRDIFPRKIHSRRFLRNKNCSNL